MVVEATQFLKTISFKDTANWNIKQSFNETPIKSRFDFSCIGEYIHRRKDAMKVEGDKEYKRVTIKTKNGGVVVRDIILGDEIKTKDQYYVSMDQLVVSKIDARNGAFGVVPADADKAIITGNFWAYDVDATRVNIQYLLLIFSSEQFVEAWQNCSNGSGNRLYLQEKQFLQQNIPLPKIGEQNGLVKQYEDRMAEAESHEEKIELLEASIETYLFDSLGIVIAPNKPEPTSFLSCTSLSKLVKWTVDFNLNAIKPENVFKSTKYKNTGIAHFCEINPTTEYPDDITNISFVPMECISDLYGEITSMKKGSVSLAKGYTRFQEDDVVWAKITPCMQNGKTAVAKGLDNGFAYGSTEYYVFRPFENVALPEYIHAFLRTAYMRKVARVYFTGSVGQQRVGMDLFEGLTLPEIPPTSENSDDITQAKIVAHISGIKEQIKALRQKAESLRKLAKKEFDAAVFSE